MPVIDSDAVLDEVEYIVVSGSGVLDFAVVGGVEYYTWWGAEDADWEINGVERVENDAEDRVVVYPTGEPFYCEVSASVDEFNTGPVRCRSG